MLIVGGHRHEFALIQGIYQITEAAGIGYVQAALPDTLRNLIGGGEFGHFLPASPSGSLGRAALGELLHLAEGYDGIIIGANLTNNSETSVLIESLIARSQRPIIITEEAIESFKFNPKLITNNAQAVVVTTMPGLFALANHHHLPLAIKPNRGVMGKIEILQQIVDISRCSYLVFDADIIVAAEEQISLTPLERPLSQAPAIAIGLASVLWLQNRSKTFQALTTAAYLAHQATQQPDATLSAVSRAIRAAMLAHEDASLS